MKWWCLFVLVLLFSGFSSAQICANNLALNGPKGVTSDVAGNKYVADTNNNRIIKIDSSGVPSVLAGDPAGASGFVDGNTNVARFNSPHKIMVNSAGTFLYVADTNNNAIRKINLASGAVSTVSGQGPSNSGNTDGPLSAAKFDHPKGIFVTTLDEVLVADTNNHVIRRISESANQVMTIIGTGSAANVNCPALLNCPDATPTSCLSLGLNAPQDIIVSTTGPLSSPPPTNYYEIFIANTGAHSIKGARYELGSGFSTYACQGNLLAGNGVSGYAVGSSTQQVQFNSPTAIESLNYGSNGLPASFTYTGIPYLLVADSGNNVLRYLSQDSNGYRFTVPYAGAATIPGNIDGATSNPFTGSPSSTARFNSPNDLSVRANSAYPYSSPNNFLVVDSSSSTLKTITGTSTNAVWNVASVNGGTCNIATNTCPTSDDVILRLSSSTNAHGETYSNTGTYTTDVCYSQIFGTTYSGANPHVCSGGSANRVLRLSSSTNAHSEIPDATSPSYTTDVCYGDLVCHSVAGNVNCGVGEQEVVSLSSSTNAHLETPGANSYSSSSNYKICCSNTPVVAPGTITSVGWAYSNLAPIPASTLFCPNSLVYAYAVTSGLANGATVNFNFFDWDPLSNDFIFGPTPITVNNNLAIFPVNFADPQVQNALSSFLDGTNNDVELFFDATTPTSTMQSYFVRYVDDVELCQFPGPTASVTAPVHQGVYFANTPINFVATCSSQTGLLTYNWNIVQNGQTITNTNPTFTQTFAQGGQATITLTCTDSQSLSATAEAQILIVASPFAFAYINDPAWNSVEYELPVPGQAYFPRQVTFDASQTFAVDTTGTCAVSCLGGSCPLQTQNSPSSCTGTNGLAGGPLTITGAPSNPGNAVWSGVNFDWTFWDSNWNNPWTSNEGPGAVSGALEYDDMSNSLQDKHMSINVQVVSGSSTASASFQRDFTLGRCMNNGNSLWFNGQLQSTSQPGMCLGGDQLPNTGDECCPTGQDCVEDLDGGFYSCQFLANPITRCEDFTEANSCNSNTNVAYPLASNGGIAPTTQCTILRCHWIDDSTGCGVQEVQYSSNPSGTCDPTTTVSSCAWSTQQTACVNGRKTITYMGASTNSATCNRPQVIVPCGSLNFELDFFGIAQFVSAFLIIGLFYAMFGIIKQNRKT